MAKRRARKTSPLYLPSAFDLFSPSKELVMKNIWVFGPLYGVMLILGLHSWIWSPSPSQQTHYWWSSLDGVSSGTTITPLPLYAGAVLVGFSILWFLFSLAVGTIAQIMAQESQLEAAANREPAFHKLWATVKELGWRMLGLYAAMAIIIGVGFILLIIPGLFMLRRYILAPYVMLDKRCGIADALERSAKLSKINTGAVWGLLGVLFLISLLHIVPIIGGLASFVIGALYSVAPALRYNQLKKLV